MTTTITTFDITERLETEEDIREFLKAVSNTGNPSDHTHALNIAVKTKGMTEVDVYQRIPQGE